MVRKLAAATAALVVAAAAVLAFQYLKGPATTPLRPGDAIPDVELPAVEGGAPARVRANLGPATLIVFLDTRWPPTARYAQFVERLYRRYQRRGFRVIGICLDDSPDALRDFIRSNAITFTMLHDPGGRATRAGWGAAGGPVTYLVDAGGRVIAAHPEPIDWRREEHRGRIEALLPSPPPGGF